jgi:uncharacterized damage-inducible protein DinB
MSIFTPMNWISRQWEFGQTAEDALDSLQLLSGTAEKMHALVHRSDPEKLRQRVDDKWSVNEHAGHLLTMESLWIARLDDFVLGRPTLRPWNGTNADTEAAEFNRQRLGKIISDFAEIRASHLQLLEKFRPAFLSMQAYHERLNRTMTLADHLYFMAEHDRHHLSTIEKLIGS